MWGAFFVVGALVKSLAFSNDTVWLSLPPDASLWAVGLLVADILAHQDSAGATLEQEISPAEDGYYTRFKIRIAGDPRDNPARFYLAFFGMAGWMATLVLTEYAMRELDSRGISAATVFVLAISHLLAFLIVWHALRAVIPQGGGAMSHATTETNAGGVSAPPADEPRTS